MSGPIQFRATICGQPLELSFASVSEAYEQTRTLRACAQCERWYLEVDRYYVPVDTSEFDTLPEIAYGEPDELTPVTRETELALAASIAHIIETRAWRRLYSRSA